mmetsp:Transcript_67438/g.188172  ORF Transcript_67438/g.188172 Transcript_67438/m.188172 type:complete len:362 (-) Transcript_67438:19-1104(-)
MLRLWLRVLQCQLLCLLLRLDLISLPGDCLHGHHEHRAIWEQLSAHAVYRRFRLFLEHEFHETDRPPVLYHRFDAFDATERCEEPVQVQLVGAVRQTLDVKVTGVVAAAPLPRVGMLAELRRVAERRCRNGAPAPAPRRTVGRPTARGSRSAGGALAARPLAFVALALTLPVVRKLHLDGVGEARRDVPMQLVHYPRRLLDGRHLNERHGLRSTVLVPVLLQYSGGLDGAVQAEQLAEPLFGHARRQMRDVQVVRGLATTLVSSATARATMARPLGGRHRRHASMGSSAIGERATAVGWRGDAVGLRGVAMVHPSAQRRGPQTPPRLGPPPLAVTAANCGARGGAGRRLETARRGCIKCLP